jgi:putative Mn2+ efflux pump MntP
VIVKVDHWIAFILLGIIGINMIRESRDTDAESLDSSFGFKAMLPLAVATSIDALAVGVTFAFLNVNILWAVTFIGVITFILSSIGVKVGHVFGLRYKGKAEFTGGLILVLMGCKILLEHLGILG